MRALESAAVDGIVLQSGEPPTARAMQCAASTALACRIHINTPTLQDCERACGACLPYPKLLGK
jgi:hypothetical protein